MDFSLLKQLCTIYAPAGDEIILKEFILDYVAKHQDTWKVKPQVLTGKNFQDCIVLVFGEPKTAIYAHMDSIGFTVRYGKELVKLGGPCMDKPYTLIGADTQGEIECTLIPADKGDKRSNYYYHRDIDRGTNLVFKPEWRESKEFIQCCYLDNRAGVFNALKVCETLENGAICFTCWEETGGGVAGYLAKFLFEQYGVTQSLISDITWVTEGVKHGKGVAISMRDSGIPRKSFVKKIIDIAAKSKIPYQLEVEDAGGSDGNKIQASSYPVDWCFVGAPESNVHTPDEELHKADLEAMVNLYKVLMREL
ncbi:MAG: M20/M25/M40 family metallo-hydrolase [Luteibaculaceae bacterium]